MRLSSIFFWRRRRSRYATGGVIKPLKMSGDEIPVFLSHGRSTMRRPGETWSQAMNRLTEGKDL